MTQNGKRVMQHSQQCGMLAKGCESVSMLREHKKHVSQALRINSKLHAQSPHTKNIGGINCAIVSAPIVPQLIFIQVCCALMLLSNAIAKTTSISHKCWSWAKLLGGRKTRALSQALTWDTSGPHRAGASFLPKMFWLFGSMPPPSSAQAHATRVHATRAGKTLQQVYENEKTLNIS